MLGNPTEGALLLWLKARNADYQVLRANAFRIEELPFTTERKYMATVVRSATGKISYMLKVLRRLYSQCVKTHAA